MAFTTEMSIVRKAGNAGLVTATGGGAGFEDLLHTLPVLATHTRSARIVKIMVYHALGGPIPLLFGTMNRNPAGAAFVQLLPTLTAISGIENVWLETELPDIEFQSDRTATAAGRTGDIYVQDASAGGALISIVVDEKI